MNEFEEMAKYAKFDVDLFRRKWFRRLSPTYKSLYLLLVAESDVAGVFEIDPEAWRFALDPKGETIDTALAFKQFGKEILKVGEYHGIVTSKLDSVQFSPRSAQYMWVRESLSKIGLTPEQVEEMKNGKPKAGQDEACKTEDPKKAEKKLRNQIPPPREEVEKYFAEMKFTQFTAEGFIDYYTSNGWQVGRTKMKDWQSAMRNWERMGKTRKASRYQQPTKTKIIQAERSEQRNIFD